MSKIVFFCIPAYGHTNPTLGVVRELTARGHEVRYYSYEPMRTLIEAAGAQFFACDPYDCEQHLTPADGARVGKDIVGLFDISCRGADGRADEGVLV